MNAQQLWTKVRNPLWTVAALIIVIVGLEKAETVLVPFMTAVFLAIICAPGVKWLQRYKVPNWLAVLLVILTLLGLIAGVGALVGSSVNDFVEQMPTYRDKLDAKFRQLAAFTGNEQLTLSMDKIYEVADPGKLMALVGNSVKALGGMVSDAILVVLTTVFILMEGASIPIKLRTLMGTRGASGTGQLARIAADVQRYMGIKTVLSLATGVFIGVWAAILKVDFPLVWGLLAFLLNYIPNLGSIIAAVPACLLALIDEGAVTALLLGGGYVAVNMVLGNVVEPAWMGRKLGLSTLVVFLSLVVWGAIWGPIGMLLSVPLTMAVKIMLEDSKEWSHFAVLLDSSAPEPEAKEPDAAADAEPADG